MAFREVTERWAQWRFERQAKELLEPLYRVALRLTGKHEDAEDLVQDTIIKAYRAFARARFDGPAGERAWFFTILANGFRDGYRRRRRTPEVPFAALEDDAESNVIELVPDLAPGPDLQADATLFREAAQAVIERLPPEVRLRGLARRDCRTAASPERSGRRRRGERHEGGNQPNPAESE